jgi:hypothetical protein
MPERPPGAGRIAQSLKTVDGKRPAPLSHRDRRNPQCGRDLLVIRRPPPGQCGCASPMIGASRRNGRTSPECCESRHRSGGKRHARHEPSVSEVPFNIKNYLYVVLALRLCASKRLVGARWDSPPAPDCLIELPPDVPLSQRTPST